VPQLIPNVFSDLDLTLIPHPTKRAVPRLLDADAVKRSVRLLVMTKHHERLFHPEIGCDATQILFEPVSPITELNLKRSIEDVINNFEPRARLRSVTVKWDMDNNAYQANIEFFIANNPSPISLGLVLERVR
jgi:phage baseplate assembly protein W